MINKKSFQVSTIKPSIVGLPSLNINKPNLENIPEKFFNKKFFSVFTYSKKLRTSQLVFFPTSNRNKVLGLIEDYIELDREGESDVYEEQLEAVFSAIEGNVYAVFSISPRASKGFKDLRTYPATSFFNS